MSTNTFIADLYYWTTLYGSIIRKCQITISNMMTCGCQNELCTTGDLAGTLSYHIP